MEVLPGIVLYHPDDANQARFSAVLPSSGEEALCFLGAQVVSRFKGSADMIAKVRAAIAQAETEVRKAA